MDIREVDGFRLIYLANYWNRGKWSKEFGPDDENWETNKGLKEKLDYEITADGTFWMRFEDWLINFNTLYYCRIFPESWSQFCIPGCWTGITSGGAPPRTNQKPWAPEKPNEEGKANSPLKMNTRTSLQYNASSLSSKTSILQANVGSNKEFNQAGKRLSKANFKLNILPAVDEGKDEEEQMPNNLTSAMSLLKSNKKLVSNNNIRPSVSNSSINAILSNPRVSVLKNSPNNLTKTFNLNGTSVSEFKNTKNVKIVTANKSLYPSKNPDLIKRLVINDTEDRWFLNPQYKLEIKPGTKLIISLMQEDERVSHNPYQRCNFIIILTRSKYSRVWDPKEDYIIKKASESEDSKVSREKILYLDYNEVLRKLSNKNKKKILAKSDRLYLNIIPYLEYYQKYEIERIGSNRTFKLVHKEGTFWLRIFASDEIYVAELAKPYERSIDYEWTTESAGGGRYIQGAKNKIEENPHWPINPQYLLIFENNISMKIILRKTFGRYGEEEKVGMVLTKPDYEDNIAQIFKNQKTNNIHSVNKTDQIQRVVDSTNKILASKKIDLNDITKKMTFNASEWVVESSYSNNYCGSLFMNFNKIDSPIMLLPTLENNEVTFNYKLFIYSNKPVQLFSLNNEDSKVLIGEWKDQSAGGCHLSSDEKPGQKDEDYTKRRVDWYDNPKFHLAFDSKDRIPEISFDIILTRSQTIWKKKVANSIVNSMMGVYIFKYDKEKWKEQCTNMTKIDFVPKSEIVYKFQDTKVDPKGYIIMPATYGQNVYGPFTMMIKCKQKFTLAPFNPK